MLKVSRVEGRELVMNRVQTRQAAALAWSVAALSVTACGAPAAPVATALGRTARTVTVPTLAEMKAILPATLSDREADRRLVRVSADHVLVPSATGWLEPGGIVHPSWLGPLGAGRFFPFSYYGAPFFAPYSLNPALGLWSPLAFSPLAGPYPFLAGPWVPSCGIGLPPGLNFAPASVGAAIGTFGCGGGVPVLPPW